MATRKLNDLAGYYDSSMRRDWGREYDAFRASVVSQFGDFRNKTILDYGCGTGLLLQYIKEHHAYEGRYLACDAGANMLELASTKNIPHADLVFTLIPETPKLPFESASVDIAVSSLVTHQLPPAGKRAMFSEILRVLKPGGVFVLAEFGKSTGFMGFMTELYVRHLWGRFITPAVYANSAENFSGAVPRMVEAAGFNPVAVTSRWKGNIDVIRAVKP
jgi:ubiquinone/menaquinone biosynthesis C-methylase UbiE